MTLRVQLLGDLSVSENGESLPTFPTYKSSALLAYLVLQSDRLHPRQVLADLFWSDRSERASRKCLRTELWRIRRILSRNGREAPLVTENGSVGFDPEADVWVDVAEFEQRILSSMRDNAEEVAPEEHRRLREAVDLWRGELLEGWYEDWCLYHRERFNTLYVYALRRLMRYRLSQGRWSLALVRGYQLLQADPLLEQGHRDLMYCYWRMGNRPAALRQYALLARTLHQELAVEPMAETRTLFDHIRNDRKGHRGPPSTSREDEGAKDGRGRRTRRDGPETRRDGPDMLLRND